MAFNISVSHINALCIALQTFYSDFQSGGCCIIDHPDILCVAKFYHRPFLIGYCLITVDAYHSLIIICLFVEIFSRSTDSIYAASECVTEPVCVLLPQ